MFIVPEAANKVKAAIWGESHYSIQWFIEFNLSSSSDYSL
jgi:hypothetical protein